MAFPTGLTTWVDGITELDASWFNVVEEYLGILSSADPDSLNYKLCNPASVDPGHKHSEIDGGQTALTAALTGITHTEPGTPDYALQDVTQTTPWGFATQDEANTVLKVLHNVQTRVAELELRLQNVGILPSP